MLAVAGLLVALQVGKCPQGYNVHRMRDLGSLTVMAEVCASEVPPSTPDDLLTGQENWNCDVAHEFRCCTKVAVPNSSAYACVEATKEQCEAEEFPQWCPPPAEPADDGISEAIVTVIVFVSLVAVAGAAGAYAVCRM